MSYSACGLFHSVGTDEKLIKKSRYPILV